MYKTRKLQDGDKLDNAVFDIFTKVATPEQMASGAFSIDPKKSAEVRKRLQTLLDAGELSFDESGQLIYPSEDFAAKIIAGNIPVKTKPDMDKVRKLANFYMLSAAPSRIKQSPYFAWKRPAESEYEDEYELVYNNPGNTEIYGQVLGYDYDPTLVKNPGSINENEWADMVNSGSARKITFGDILNLVKEGGLDESSPYNKIIRTMEPYFNAVKYTNPQSYRRGGILFKKK